MRERDPWVGSAVGAVGDLRSAAVGARDRLDDRQPEPGAAAAAGGIAAREAIEGGGEQLGREARPVVADVELDATLRHGCGQLDGAAAVAQRVVDEVPERLLEAPRIDVDR